MKGIPHLFKPTDSILAVLSLGSGIYTYLGARQLLDGESLLAHLAALVYATCVTLMIWLFWMWVTRVLPTTHSTQSKICGWMAVLLGVGAICGTSSSFNATALIGPAALDLHESQILSAYEAILDKTHRTTIEMKEILPDLREGAERYRKLRDKEAVGAGPSGLRGSGTVTTMLDQVASRLDGLADQIETSLDEINEHQREATYLLKDMRDLNTAGISGRERRDQFRELTVEMDEVLAKMEAAAIVRTIKRTSESLVAELVLPERARKKLISNKQRAAEDIIKEAVETTTKKLAESVKRMNKSLEGLPERPKFTPLHAIEAVFVYSGNFVPAWIGAVAIDLLPLILLVFIVIAESNLKDSAPPNPSRHMTMEEFLQFKELDEHLQHVEKVRRFPYDRAS